VQQTFCKAIERLDTYRGEAALYTWFCQICRNVVADHYRRNSRGGSRVVLLEDLPDARAILESFAAPAADEPETGAMREQVHRLVEATLDALPGRYGEALEWKYIDGLSVREIAGRLALGEKATESLLTRARESFREAIAGIF
jgi:RNA polymerase sigma-70 factor (ECF subfamily)